VQASFSWYWHQIANVNGATPGCQESGAGCRKDEARQLVGVSASCLLLPCFDTVGWMRSRRIEYINSGVLTGLFQQQAIAVP